MDKLTVYLALLLPVIACKPVPQEYDEYYGVGFVKVNEVFWPFEYTTPYPFTVPYGEISCGYHPEFGREVYFAPDGFTDESYIGTPLNKSAVGSLRQNNMHANVPYSVKDDADLSEAIEIGLRVCDEYQGMLDTGI